ncbi:hypothetical protein BH09BAC6_BH09BAC6_30510 [soil metagenome]
MISKLNARLIIIHFIACWFFIYAFHTLSSLWDYSFLYTPAEQMNRANDPQRFATDMSVINESGALGLIVAYIISWQISIRRNWFWLNAVIVFVVAYILKYNNLLGWSTLQQVFLAPGHIFRVNSIACFLTNGLIMLLFGSLLFFLKPVTRFIDKGAAPAETAPGVKTAGKRK